jgi:ribosomal protein S27AE
MIRLFSKLCKTILNCLTDEDLFLDATDGFKHYDKSCPCCGATGKLAPHGDYTRWLVFLKSGVIFCQRLRPLRFICSSCGTTHALLPDILVPYSPYSLRFKLVVLIAYYERESTVVEVCERYNIAISTLYRWIALFLLHKDLFLGILLSQKQPAIAFLHGLFNAANISNHLHSFFHKYSSSFLQNPHTAARTAPP